MKVMKKKKSVDWKVLRNRNSAGDVRPSDESNEVQGTVNHLEKANPVSNQLPKDCYPKDQLSPEELLPENENSKWAQSNPKEKRIRRPKLFDIWLSHWCQYCWTKFKRMLTYN